MSKKEKTAEQIVKEAMHNVDDLQKVNKQIQNEQNVLTKVPEQKTKEQNEQKTKEQNEQNVISKVPEQPTLFMMNNNEAPNQQSKPFLTEAEAKPKIIKQSNAYGIVAIVMSLVAICLVAIMFLMYMSFLEQMSGSSQASQLIGNFLFILTVPIFGWIGGTISTIIAFVFGIVGAVKSKKRAVSWIGLALSVICLIVNFALYIPIWLI